jgi:hypothetical protein
MIDGRLREMTNLDSSRRLVFALANRTDQVSRRELQRDELLQRPIMQALGERLLKERNIFGHGSFPAHGQREHVAPPRSSPIDGEGRALYRAARRFERVTRCREAVTAARRLGLR